MKNRKAVEKIFKNTCTEEKCMQKAPAKLYVTKKYGKKHIGGKVSYKK